MKAIDYKKPGSVSLLSGRGRKAQALRVAFDAAKRSVGVALFSDARSVTLANLLLSEATGIPLSRIRSGRIRSDDRAALEGARRLCRLPLWSSRSRELAAVRRDLRALVEKRRSGPRHRIRLVVIHAPRAADATALRRLARRFDVSVVAAI